VLTFNSFWTNAKNIFPGLTAVFYSLSKLTVFNCYVNSVFRFFKLNVYYYFDVYPETSLNFMKLQTNSFQTDSNVFFSQICSFATAKTTMRSKKKKKNIFGICKVTIATPRCVVVFVLAFLFRFGLTSLIECAKVEN
jgi:hypothetical protein